MKKRLLVLSLASALLFGCSNDAGNSILSNSNSTGGGTSSNTPVVSTTEDNTPDSSEAAPSETTSEGTGTNTSDKTSTATSDNQGNTSSEETPSTSSQGGQTSSSNTPETSEGQGDTSSHKGDEEELPKTKVWFMGDQYSATINHVSSSTDYYYQPQGIGYGISSYFNDKVTFENLSVNKGEVTATNYDKHSESKEKYNHFKDSESGVKSGDYVIISFGANDRSTKTCDSDLNGTYYGAELGSKDTEGTFQYNLYTKFIKVAEDAGATAILVTPYANFDNKGSYNSNTKYVFESPSSGSSNDSSIKNGNYHQAIIDLATELNLLCIDNTKLSADALRQLDVDTAKKWYTWKDTKANTNNFNDYGARKMGYLMAQELKKSNNPLGKYIKDDIVEPQIDELQQNKNWKSPYTVQEGWNASAFGTLTSTGYDMSQFKVNGTAESVTLADDGEKVTGSKTKQMFTQLSSSKDSMVTYYQQVPVDKNFSLSAHAKLKSIQPQNRYAERTAFGAMVGDNIYQDQFVTDLKYTYLATGILGMPYQEESGEPESGTYKPRIEGYHSWYRKTTDAKMKLENTASEKIIAGYEIDVKVEKTKDGIFAYYKTSSDQEFTSCKCPNTCVLTTNDPNYYYVGLFISGGINVTFTNVSMTVTNPAA